MSVSASWLSLRINPPNPQGDYYNVAPMRLGRQFARAILSSTLEGSTSYREAYELLGVKGNKAFQGVAEKLGVA